MPHRRKQDSQPSVKRWVAELHPMYIAGATLVAAMSLGAVATAAATGYIGLPGRVSDLEVVVASMARTLEIRVCRDIAVDEGFSVDRCFQPGEKARFLPPALGRD